MDTDSIVAAMRSPTGASAALLRAARAGKVSLVATTALCIEYEEVCSRREHVIAAGFGTVELTIFLDAVVALMAPVDVWFLWRPQLRDPADELVLEAAVNGQARVIVTFNRRDFRSGAERFGIDILLPSEAIQRFP
jgi:predicted nucleic acid-binding protein